MDTLILTNQRMQNHRVRVDKDQYEQISHIADTVQTTRTDVINRLLEFAMQHVKIRNASVTISNCCPLRPHIPNR